MDLTGCFIVAAPALPDPNFRETVVLMLEHDDEEGSLGLVLNRPGPIAVGLFCAGLGIQWQGKTEAAVHLGGPVQPMIGWLLHGEIKDADESREIMEGIFVSNSRETLELVAGNTDVKRRLFAGYAGWAPGQLRSELHQGVWFTGEADPGLVFARKPEQIWRQAIRNMGIEPDFLVPGSFEPS
jgi:putative transcriptional regulator